MTFSRVSQLCRFATLALLIVGGSFLILAQQSTTTNAVVPTLVQFSGMLTSSNGKPLTNITGVTFALYAEQEGGAPLWLETQNVQPDETGRYSVMLGSTSSQGLPSSLFVSGQARWLGVQPQGELVEQPRIMLLSVPYALKAGDAQTVGGLPPSAFVLATAPNGAASAYTTELVTQQSVSPATATDVTTTGGTVNTLPLFSTATNIQNSLLTQTGTTAINVGGKLNLPAYGTATSSVAFNSRPLDFVASSYDSSTSAAVAQTFQWQAQVAGNDTSSPSGTLNLLYGSGMTTPAQTGLHIANTGLISFAKGQTFPGTGTITGVTAGTDLTGGGTSGTVTLNLDTTKVPQLVAANTFTGNQTVNGNVSATGVVTGSSYQIRSNLFAFGSYGNGNAFLGFAGNSTSTGIGNTATGESALGSNTTGNYNTATGNVALFSNTLGSYNTASGYEALYSNTGDTSGDGWYNTAVGNAALFSNTLGSENAAFGYRALSSNTGDAAGDGWYNSAFGYHALSNNTLGSYNTASGYEALYSNTGDASGDGDYNTATGYLALQNNTTGYENTAFGAFALSSNTTGNDLTCIGYNCEPAAPALTNATAIGAHAVVGQSNALVLGGTGKYAVNVGIGTTTPSNILTIGRGTGHPVSDSWETYSSRRWKTNIHTLPDALARVEQLRGVSYDLKDSGKHEIGVIAEEVGAVVPEVVTYEDNGKDARAVDYSRLTALLIEATKEQQALIRKQQQQIRMQHAQIAHLSSQVKAIQASLQTDGRVKTEIRTVKAQVPMVHQ